MKKNNSPLISIITPSYNSESFISQTIDSVIRQTYTNWELLITDDCSTDNTIEIVESYIKNDSRIKLFKLEKNSGAGIARNFSINKAQGSYIAFLDSDDLWHIDKLAIQILFMQENNYFFSHTSYGYIDEEGNRIKSTLHVSREVNYMQLLKRTEISCLTAIYNADQIGKFYMSEHARKQDYALWLAILKSGVSSFGIDEELASYRQVKNSSTSNKYKLILKHITFLKETQNLSTINAFYYTAYWMVNGFVRYFIN